MNDPTKDGYPVDGEIIDRIHALALVCADAPAGVVALSYCDTVEAALAQAFVDGRLVAVGFGGTPGGAIIALKASLERQALARTAAHDRANPRAS